MRLKADKGALNRFQAREKGGAGVTAPRHPRATSSTIIRVKPTENSSVPKLE